MSKAKVAPKAPTAKVPPRPPALLEDLLHTVEDRCNRAVAIINATARAVEGDELGLHDEGGPEVFARAPDHAAAELSALSDRALKARVGGAA